MPFLFLCALLFCTAAHAQDLEDIPLSDPVIPTLAPTKAPITKPTAKPIPTRAPKAALKIAPATKPKPTAKPTPAPAKTVAPAAKAPAAALPLPAPAAPALPPLPTPKVAPTKAASPALEDAPLADTPLEDAPIPDAPAGAAPATPNAASPNAASPNAPLEDAPIPDAAPDATTNAAAPIAGATAMGTTPVPDLTLPPENAGHAHDTDEAIHADTFADPNAFLWQAFYAGALVALMCSFLGLYVVTRRMVFIGIALAELSSAGIALSLLVGPLLAGSALGFLAPHLTILGALGFMLLGVILLSIRWAPRVLPPDTPVGVFYLLASAAGILMIAKSAQGEGHMLTLLRGDVLAVYPSETLQMGLVFAGLALVHGLFGKEFLLVSLDRDSAATQGYNASRWDFLLLLTIGVAVSLSIRSVGVLLTTAMLVLPAATALLAFPRWKIALLVAPLLGLVSVALGLYLSLVGDFPASAVIVAVQFILLLPVLIWKTLRR